MIRSLTKTEDRALKGIYVKNKVFPALIAFLLYSVSALLPAPIAAERIDIHSTGNRMLEIDFEGPVFEDPGYQVKDHSLIKKDGLFHIYYIRGNGKTFGHATSPDLRHWTIDQPVLETGPEEWDSNWIWAPHVVPSCCDPGYYYMYYTGVTPEVTQRTCLAYTTGDLRDWIKPPLIMFEPFHPDTSWAMWREGEWSNHRDPYYFTDNGTNYMLNSVNTLDGKGAIALAFSDGCLEWEDAGPLYVHDSWHMLESSCLIKHGGRYHLFFTEEAVGGISWMGSDSLRSGWDIVTRMIIDGGHACELTPAGTDSYVFSRHSSYSLPGGSTMYTVRFDTLGWNGDFPQVLKTDVLDSMWTRLWGTAFDCQPVYGNTYSYRGIDTTEIGFEGNWWIGTYERFEGPIYATPGSIQGDSATGAIQSGNFVVKGFSMRLLVGGGNYPDSCYVALYEAETGEIIYSETGRNRELMDERFWDLEPWRGRNVYLKIVDRAVGHFGHINVDGIEERGSPIIVIPDSARGGPPPKDIDPFKEDLSGGAETGPSPGISIKNYPNPFNPATNLVVRAPGGSDLQLKIFSVSGKMITTIPLRVGSSGTARVVWKGEDENGNMVSSGVYSAVVSGPGIKSAGAKLVLLR